MPAPLASGGQAARVMLEQLAHAVLIAKRPANASSVSASH